VRLSRHIKAKVEVEIQAEVEGRMLQVSGTRAEESACASPFPGQP
jgi:hypothetical protein